MGIFVPRNLAQPEVFPAEALVEKLEDLVLSEAFKGVTDCRQSACWQSNTESVDRSSEKCCGGYRNEG